METYVEAKPSRNHLEQTAAILQIAGWTGFVIQIGLAAAVSILLLLAISGRTFNQAIAAPPEIPVTRFAATQATTPGLGVGIFWAICSFLVLLFGIYLAFRLIRFSKRLRNPNSMIHPTETKVMEVLKLAVIVGLVGILLAILGTGTTVAVLLAKSVAQPQGVSLYAPSRIVRSLDVFVVAANTTGLTAHFVGAVASLGAFSWLYERR